MSTKFFILSFLNLICINNSKSTDLMTLDKTYKAAVMEFAPSLKQNYVTDTIVDNGKEYVNYIHEASAQKAQIIVFPECGLTGCDLPNAENIEQISTTLPDPIKKISPCDKQVPEQNIVVLYLSCAARDSETYVVANLFEKEFNNATSRWIYYNTNVAFDRKGVVVARHRKINLYNEPLITSGDKSQVSIFKTDFGVTFGIIISFDIMSFNPAQSILVNTDVTDIIISTAWFSTLPFYSALSVYHGYAVSSGVNVLAAGLNEPTATIGGSGIFFADGSIGKLYVSGFRKSKMLIKDIPIIKERIRSTICKNSYLSKTSTAHENTYTYTEQFNTQKFDLSSYTHKSVEVEKGEVTETLCSGKNNLCCIFNLHPNKYPNDLPIYKYKMLAFDGVQKMSENNTIGVRHCGVVACLNDSITSCGERHPNSRSVIYFDKLNIKSNLKPNNYVQPSTLNFDLKPVVGYRYCVEKDHTFSNVNISNVIQLNSLLTFGFYIREFENDGKPPGVNAANTFSKVYIVILNILLLFILQE